MNAALRSFLMVAAAVPALIASNFSFTGTFSASDDIQLFTFTTSGQTTIRTLSYGGGVNVSGLFIPADGFDPLLGVFDSTGLQLGAFDDGSAGGGGCAPGVTAGTNGCLDSFFSDVLAAGTYTLSLTQFDNNLNGTTLADGFLSQQACSAVFCDGFDTVTPRTGRWAVDLLSVDSAAATVATPEPGTIGILAAGILMIMLLRKRIFPLFS